MTQRLDSFTDAAFAFAVTLLVIGGAGAPTDFEQLSRALSDIPAYLAGFACITLFWFAHVSWRSLRGEGDWRSILLTLALVFLVLIYVQPLRAMTAALALYFTGQGGGFRGSLAVMFAVYGAGFTTMALTMVALFHDALRNTALDAEGRAVARGQRGIWLLCALTGIVSVLISGTPLRAFAGWVYATLGVTVPIFASLYDWEEKKAAGE
jgi:uncharacterized membrane protein